jgi:hypothetical protein
MRLVLVSSAVMAWLTLAGTAAVAQRPACDVPPPPGYCPPPPWLLPPSRPQGEQAPKKEEGVTPGRPLEETGRPSDQASQTDTSSQSDASSQPSQVAASGAAGTVNIMGDLISGPTIRSVTIPVQVTMPVTHYITVPSFTVTVPSFTSTFTAFGQPPGVTVTPPPFTFTPTGSLTPPSFFVQPGPVTLPNGQTVLPPPVLVQPSSQGVSSSPVTVQPAPFTATPPPVSVTAGPATTSPQNIVITPPPIAFQTVTTVTILEQRFFEVLTAATRASSFKIAEDNSPLPQCRAYFNFNYFDNVAAAVNRRLGNNVNDISVYRESLGAEKTFFDGTASVEVRVPLATLDVASDLPGVASTDTNIGDVSVAFKYAPYINFETGNCASLGLVVTAPTGPTEFNPFHSTILQPFVGYKYFFVPEMYVQGFTSIAVPTDTRDVTLLFNDIALGFYLYRNTEEDACLRGIIPTAELHVNTPLNHRGAFNFADPSGTPDWVTITAGGTLELGRRSTFATGIAVPVTGPKPYDFEVLAQYNLHF